MIISKTPYRISFFGGGTDYPDWYLENGGEVISTTINKYIYISCRNLPSFFKHNYRIVYSKVENVKKISQIIHPVIKESLLFFFKKKISSGLEIHYNGELPARSGMGSSSSFAVGLLNTLYTYFNFKINKKLLANKSIFLERELLKETVGSQDQVAASFGGFNSIKFDKKGNYQIDPIFQKFEESLNLNKNLYLIYTDISRTAKFIANTYIKKLTNVKKKQMLEIIDHVKIGKQLLKDKNFDDFGILLNETWKIKRSLSNKVSSNLIDDIYLQGINSGATGGKLLGAGGGGFVLFYVPNKNRINFLRIMKKYKLFTFDFTNIGSTIVYNDE